MWLLDEKGAEVNATSRDGRSALHHAASLDILTASLNRDADLTHVEYRGWSALIYQAGDGPVDNVARLLQDPRAHATVNMRSDSGRTALHCACMDGEASAANPKARLLLQAGAGPFVTRNGGETPLDLVRRHYPYRLALISLLEQYQNARKDAEKASLLVKARRLAVAATSNAVVPSCLQARVARGQPLPRVALVPLTDGQTEGEVEDKKDEGEGRNLRTILAFICGVGREGMPRDVFRVVMDFFMPSWDPLRRRGDQWPVLPDV